MPCAMTASHSFAPAVKEVEPGLTSLRSAQAELLTKACLCPCPGEDFVDIPENFFGVGGEEDITVQTVTWPDVELPLPRNITEGEARGNVILTVRPVFSSPTAVEPEEPFTLAPGREATAFPGAENGTGEATRTWALPKESTPGLGPFTSEDLVVQVTAIPAEAEVPGQPRLPGGKCPLLGGLQGQEEKTWPGGLHLHLNLGRGQASLLSESVLLICETKGTGQARTCACSMATKHFLQVKS